MNRPTVRWFVFLVMLALHAAPASSQGLQARPGAGYVARALTGGIPIGAVRGRYPGATTDVLFVVNHPAPDSTAISAFAGRRLVRRISIPFRSDQFRFVEADIPAPDAGMPAPSHVFATFDFDSDDETVRVLWNHNLDRWAGVVRIKADGAQLQAGDIDWFGEELLEAQYPRGGPEGGLPARAWKQDRRQLGASETLSLHVERTAYREVPDVYYSVGVYDGEVGPVQMINGTTSGSAPDLDDDREQDCTGLPHVTDVNGDGHADFWLCDSQGQNGYQSGTYRLYDPNAGLFVKDLAFTFLGSHTFDAATQTVYESRWGMAGAYQTQSEYSVASGVPVLIREQKREPENPSCAGGPTCRGRFTTRVRENGTMRVTESRIGWADEYLPSVLGR